MMKHMEVWEENIAKATNKRILEQMSLHAPQIKVANIRGESTRKSHQKVSELTNRNLFFSLKRKNEKKRAVKCWK
jgi:hypothetical protein